MSPTKLSSETTWKEWLLLLLLHCVYLAVASMTVGFLLEAALGHFWTDTILEPFAPGTALVALLTGYFVVSRGQSRRAAAWMWTVGVVWLAFGIYDMAWGSDAWDPTWSTEKTRFAYVIAELFGPTDKCSGSECLGELIFTMPFAASVMYSIGAYIKLRSLAKSALPKAT
jgi:hypothetical protein